MRPLLSILLIAVGFHAAFAQTNPWVFPPKYTNEEAKQLYIQHQNALPLEQRDVAYLTSDKEWSSMIPAFIDLSTSTAYEWSGVVLQYNQVPDLAGTRDGSGTIMPIDPQQMGYQVKYIDPPVRYIALAGSGKYGAGYYDANHRIFYQWDGVELDRSQIPADAESKNLILPATAIAHTSAVKPPSQYAPKSSGAATPTNPNDQTSSASDQTAQPTPPQTPKPIAEVAPASETEIPWWLYAVIVFSIAVIIGAGYCLSNRNGKGR